MRPCLAFAVVSLLLVARPATAASGEVLVLATAEGAVIRIPDAKLENCSIIKSEPPRFVVAVSGVDLASRVLPNRSEWLRSVRVIGSDALGAGESRLIIETGSTLLGLRLESATQGAAIVISGSFTTPMAGADEAVATEETATPASQPPEPEPEPAPAPKPRKKESRSRTPPPSESGATDAAPGAAPAPAPRSSSAPPATAAAQPWRNDVDGMVVIPGGEFVMGSVEGASFADESPEHPVRLRAFRLDAREVTVAEFASSPLSMPKQPDWSQDASNPVVNVTWHEAAQYCEWRDKRLPTEAEWERAARGTDRRTYPWGTQWSPTRSNSGVDGDGFTHLAPVGTLRDGAGPEGALDLSGNAWEWTADWYRKDTYAGYRTPNPEGPSKGGHKTARGGSFRSSSATTATSTVRLALPPSTRRDDVGFRCASSD